MFRRRGSKLLWGSGLFGSQDGAKQASSTKGRSIDDGNTADSSSPFSMMNYVANKVGSGISKLNGDEERAKAAEYARKQLEREYFKREEQMIHQNATVADVPASSKRDYAKDAADGSAFRYDINRAKAKDASYKEKMKNLNDKWSTAFSEHETPAARAAKNMDGVHQNGGQFFKEEPSYNPHREHGRLRKGGEGYVDGDIAATSSIGEHRAKIATLKRMQELDAEDGKVGVAHGGSDPLALFQARLGLIHKLSRSTAQDDLKIAVEEGGDLFNDLTDVLKRGPLPRARGYRLSLCQTMNQVCMKLGDKQGAMQWTFRHDNDKLTPEDFEDWENQERRYYGQKETEPTPAERFAAKKPNEMKTRLDKFNTSWARWSPEGGVGPAANQFHKKGDGYIGPRGDDYWL